MSRDDTTDAPATIGVVLKGYPRLSETFIAQEIAGLERRGLDLLLISLRHPTDRHQHPVHERIRANVLYLPEYLYQEPLRVLEAWRAVRRWPTYRAVRAAFWADLRRDRSPNRVRRFGQALVLAHELGDKVSALYAHFLHTPASATRYAAQLLAIPWAVSAHAKDVWTIPAWEKREKLAACQWLVTCTALNAEHLRGLLLPGGNGPSKVHLAYHGLDFASFPPPPPRPAGEPQGGLTIVSVGRAVPKKGYDDLLHALARLPDDLNWRFTHIGGGALGESLARLAESLGIATRVTWAGALPQPEVLAALREADLFVLASRVTDDGDRDGLPNVLMEACSQRLACVATAVSAIPEFIEDDHTGVLVPARDVEALSHAIARCLYDEALRRRLGSAAEARVRRDFSMHAGLDVVEQLVRSLLLSPAQRAVAEASPEVRCTSEAESLDERAPASCGRSLDRSAAELRRVEERG